MMLIQNENQCPGKQEKNKYSSVSWAFHMPQKNYKYHLSSIINFKKILMICLTGKEQRYSCLLFLFFFFTETILLVEISYARFLQETGRV